ncbi:MAG: ABC transporter permease [Candidatus Omnitrophota bacterium]|nr:ABC transporter permease [Candidatus Omnitrophota bacterium]
MNIELILNLIAKEFKIRYKNSVLGFLWIFLYPLMMILIFLFIFTKLFRYDLPYYPSYLLIGLIVWNYFGETTTKNLTIFIEYANIYTKTSVNKIIFVFSSVLFGTIDFLLKFSILLGVLIFLKYYLNWPSLLNINLTFVLIVPIILIEFLLIMGVSLILSIGYVYLRDLINIWGVVLQLGFFLTPIFYPDSLIPYKPVLTLNPLYHIITIFRGIMIHGKIPSIYHISLSIIFSFSILIIGIFVFNKLKDTVIEKV